ncbi:MAG: hypothetical protein WDZ79_01895 [Candidatus Paceibacterota bacterium]
MDELLRVDIFFTVTTIAVVVLALVALLALIFLVLVLNELRQLMRRIREEGESVMDDVRMIRETIERQGWRAKEAVDGLGSVGLRLAKWFVVSSAGWGAQDTNTRSKKK